MRTIACLLTCFFTLASVRAEGVLTLTVGFAAGGTSSTAARVIAEAASDNELNVIVENRPGAGGLVAAHAVRLQKSSRSLLFMSSTSALKVPPDFGLVPVCTVASFSYVAVIKKETAPDLASYLNDAKYDRWRRTVATAGAGSVSHLIGAKMFDDQNLTMVHVPYQGSAPAILAVAGGHVGMAIIPYPDFLPFKDTLQIVAETGKGFETAGWMGIYAPPGTTQEEVDQLATIFRRASERSIEKLERVGFRREWKDADGLRQQHKKDYDLWLPFLQKLGVQP